MTTINYAAALPVLRRGWERIAKGWCQGADALSAAGRISPLSAKAVKWSASGAIEGPDPFAARDVLMGITGCSLRAWNDTPGRTQAEVLALFDRAIAECEEKTR